MGPDDLKRSPTGRVPQWVHDEAAGRPPTHAVPFRAAPSTAVTQSQPRRFSGSRMRSAITLLVSAAIVVALIVVAGGDGGSRQSPFQSSAERRDDFPPTGKDEADAPLGTPATPTATSSAYRFLSRQRDSEDPVTWSPCRPIRYVVRPDNAPRGGSELLEAAIADVSRSTGLTFVDAGSTTEAPREDREAYQPDRYGDRWAPVLVSWATSEEVPDFGIDVIGEAGAQSLTTTSGDRAYVTGALALDAAGMGRLLRAGRTVEARAVVLHELGHLVGLAHVDDKEQIMFPRSSALAGYAAGDQTGLAALGRGSCQPDV